ncbi:MAG: hypothetical protein R3F49_10135 [Planctomycetota bacterium]
MRIHNSPWILGFGALIACSGLLSASRAPQEPGAGAPPGAGVRTSESCALCHSASDRASAMRDSAGRSVAPFDLWRSTMMANSARDPFWRAVMSAEMVKAPASKELIAETCLKCHAPLAQRVGLDAHGTGDPLHALECEDQLGQLARDGASCTICHGMAPDGLGTPASFSAGFELDPWRRLFGPHKDPVPGPMRMHSGFTPTYGEQITRSSLCGSCHTLITHPLHEDGTEEESIAFHEQSPYLEWRNSMFTNEGPDGELLEQASPMARTCQDCHLPRKDVDGKEIVTRLAHNPPGTDFPFIEPRKPFGRHLLVGGNAFMLSILRDNAEALDVQAPKEAFDATIAATREQLGARAASVSIGEVTRAEDTASFDVTVTNRTGHKLPTGHPSRRMWLEVVVRDAAGAVVFASGRCDDEGRIIGADGAALPTEAAGGPVEPHRDVVTSGDEVARYRAVIGDMDGAPSHTLLQGATWYVDDRVLPFGWKPDHADARATRPYGVDGDTNFGAGRDTVRYTIPVAAGAADLKVEARLLYQSVSPRWVAELRAYDTPEIQTFMAMYDRAERAPEVLAQARR